MVQGGAVTEYVGDEDNGGLGTVGAGDVGLEPAEAVDDLALPARRVQHRRVLAALGAGHRRLWQLKTARCARKRREETDSASIANEN